VLTDISQPMTEHIDSVISAEISDPTVDPLAYALVAEHMVHVPCGKLNPNSPCMKNGRCSKNYPKPFHDQTTIYDSTHLAHKYTYNLDILSPHFLMMFPHQKECLHHFLLFQDRSYCNLALLLHI
jgi:hypothetical protein